MAASWECPSLPMLSFPMKESGRASFLGIKPMISAHYEEDPESFREEIRQLDQLREHAIRPPRDYGGCSVIRRYFAQLHLLRARFPPEKGQLPIDFAWKDAFSGAEYIQEGLQIEQASVLYNLAALHSQLGCHGRRDNEQEMKEAVTHFQCAAGAITYLEEHFAVNHASKDLSPQFVALYKNLMLGQAQECLVEKSLKGVGRVKSITISKLAARVTEYYVQVSRSLEMEPCNIVAKKYKDWTRLLKVKMLYFQALSHFFQGANAEEMGKHGEMIGYHQLALHKLSAIGKIQKSLGEVVREAVRNLSEHLQANLQVSKKQNDQVYHDIVPVQETLETTPGADLVKPVSFHPVDPKSHGTDILARLVPMRAYEVASVFSEEAAKLQRSIVSSVQEKDEELEQFMTSLNVGEINKLHAGPPEIPNEVRQKHQLFQGKREAISKLHRSIQELMSLSAQVSEDLEVVATWRKEDTVEEEEFCAKFGTRLAAQACTALWRDLENYRDYHSQASKSNSELKAMFDQHYQNLMLLSGPLSMIEAAVPKMTLMDTPAEDAADIERWKELLGKVDQMKKQRSMLLARLREQISSDDITNVLIGHLGVDQDSFIDEHMKKHREIVDVIRQNLSAQDKILTALTEANAKHAGTRQAAQEMSKQQEGLFKSLVKSGGYLPLLQSKIQEGIGFYTRLHGNVTKLKKRTTEVCNTRRRERENVQRQSATPPPPPPADQDQSQPPHPPMRPPKKAELSGRPLPPEQQKLPPEFPPTDEPGSLVSDQPHQPASSVPTSQQPSSLAGGLQPAGIGSQPDMDHQLQELQRMHELQMQQLKHSEQAVFTHPSPTQSVPQEKMQQAPQQQQDQVLPQDVLEAHQPQQQTMPATGELLAPTQVQPSVSEGQLLGGPQLGTLQPQQIPSNAGSQQQAYESAEALGELQQVGEVVEGSLFHLQGDTTPGAVPEASQALLNLQMLLQPSSVTSQLPPTETIHPVHPQQFTESSPDGQEFNEEEHPPNVSPIPQRPPKPHHLQSKPKQHSPSPAPSLPKSASGSQVSTPGSEIRTLPPPQPPSDQWPQQDDEPAVPLVDQHKLTPSIGGGEQVSSIPPAVLGHMQMPPNQFPHHSIPQHIPEQTTSVIPHQEDRVLLEEPMGLPPQEERITLSSGFIPLDEVAPQPGQDVSLPAPGAGENTVTVDSFSRPIPAVQNPIHSEPVHMVPEVQPVQVDGSVPFQENIIPESREVISLEPTQPPPSEGLPSRLIPLPGVQSSTVISSTTPPPATSSQEPFEQLAAEAFAGLTLGSMAANKTLPVTSAVEDVPTLAGSTQVSEAISNDHAGSETSEEIAPLMTAQLNVSLPSQVSLITSHELPSVSLGSGSIPPLPALNSTGIDTNLASLPVSMVSVYQPIAAPLSLPTPPSVSPLPQELSAPLLHSLQPANTAHFEALLSSQQDTIREQSRQVEQQNQQISDQKAQIEDHMKQILILQQQIAQLSMQQHKQEQDKVASSGQQAVLMQLLQQQQGMFSQQQSHIEKLSEMGESHRREQMELEIKYKQALAVEQEQKSSLQNQVMQQNQEVQKLQQQLQSQAQQYQSLQFQLHQYSTQIQERDKQLIAFRDQHKQIVQNLEQRHQQKVEQLMEHIQKLQAEVKRNRELQRQQQMRPPGGGLPPPLQPVPVRSPHPVAPQALQTLLPQQVQPADLPNPPPQQPILQPTRVSPQPQLQLQLPPVHSQGAAVPHRPPQQQPPLSQKQQPPSHQQLQPPPQPSPQQHQPLPQQHQPSPQQHQPLPQQHQPSPQQHQPLPQQHQPLPQQHQPSPQQHQPLPQQHQPLPQQHQPLPQQHQSLSQQHQPSPQQHQPSPQQHQPSPQWEGQHLPQRRDTVPQQQQPFIQAATNQPTQQPPLPPHSQTLQTPQGQLQHPLQPHLRGPQLAGQPLGPRMVPTSQSHPGLLQGTPQKPPIQTPGSLPPPSPQQSTGQYSQVGQQPVQQFQPRPLNIPPGQTFPHQPPTPSGPALPPTIAGPPGQPANFAPNQQMLMQQPSRGPTSGLNFQVPSSQGFQSPRQQ